MKGEQTSNVQRHRHAAAAFLSGPEILALPKFSRVSGNAGDLTERTTARSSQSNNAAKNKHYWHSNLKNLTGLTSQV